jgi:hypothetical protein
MTTRLSLALSCLALLIPGVSHADLSIPAKTGAPAKGAAAGKGGAPAVSDESYAVYSAVLRQRFLEGRTPSLLVIESKVQSDGDGKGAPTLLEDRFGLPVKVVLMDSAEMKSMFDNPKVHDGWEAFYSRYPGAPGIIHLSKVTFGAGGDTAELELGSQSHWLAGGGYHITLKKIRGAWKIQSARMTWIS